MLTRLRCAFDRQSSSGNGGRAAAASGGALAKRNDMQILFEFFHLHAFKAFATFNALYQEIVQFVDQNLKASDSLSADHFSEIENSDCLVRLLRDWLTLMEKLYENYDYDDGGGSGGNPKTKWSLYEKHRIYRWCKQGVFADTAWED